MKAILSTGYKSVILDKPLSPQSEADTDKDGIRDWEEVKSEKLKYSDNGQAVILPTFLECISSKYDLFYVAKGLERFGKKYEGQPEISPECISMFSELFDLKVLPINSDPTSEDGDGFMDSVKNFDSKGYYTDVADKWPLTSTPKAGVLQQDGQFYYNKLTVAATNIGGRNYSEHSGSLPNEEQNLIYKMCKELKVNPNMIFAIALHESGFEADAGLGDKDFNGLSTASGYMQLLDRTWGFYASPNGRYHSNYIDILNKYNINLQNKNDSKANLAVGICCYAQCKKEKGENASIRTVVGYYGEGYESASTLEIVEYYKTISNHLNSLFEL